MLYQESKHEHEANKTMALPHRHKPFQLTGPVQNNRNVDGSVRALEAGLVIRKRPSTGERS